MNIEYSTWDTTYNRELERMETNVSKDSVGRKFPLLEDLTKQELGTKFEIDFIKLNYRDEIVVPLIARVDGYFVGFFRHESENVSLMIQNKGGSTMSTQIPIGRNKNPNDYKGDRKDLVQEVLEIRDVESKEILYSHSLAREQWEEFESRKFPVPKREF